MQHFKGLSVERSAWGVLILDLSFKMENPPDLVRLACSTRIVESPVWLHIQFYTAEMLRAGNGLVARAIRNAIRANRFARIIRN